ncbi:MAG TPA: hypothetical protein VHI98_08200 [Vicinamibacterales bacterium]|nr:hypothetical protein [Vicinamibacterales bacterium]
MTNVDDDRPRGWLFLLCRILIVYEPAVLALTLAPIVSSIAIRGWLVVTMLVARLLVAALGVAAGLALRDVRPHGVALARAALIASAAMGLLVLNTRVLPSNRMPGDDELYSLVLIAHHGAWLVYLHRSRQVRRLFPAAAYDDKRDDS